MLTKRQKEVIQMSADGLTTPAAASALGISEGTYKKHWENIHIKLGTYCRAHAVAVAFRRGWIN
jgi:LuxR family quorum sensing-dependent transcriptional regulator